MYGDNVKFTYKNTAAAPYKRVFLFLFSISIGMRNIAFFLSDIIYMKIAYFVDIQRYL